MITNILKTRFAFRAQTSFRFFLGRRPFGFQPSEPAGSSPCLENFHARSPPERRGVEPWAGRVFALRKLGLLAAEKFVRAEQPVAPREH